MLEIIVGKTEASCRAFLNLWCGSGENGKRRSNTWVISVDQRVIKSPAGCRAYLLREYLNGALPLASTPNAWWRSLRRLVAAREDLVSRRTGSIATAKWP